MIWYNRRVFNVD